MFFLNCVLCIIVQKNIKQKINKALHHSLCQGLISLIPDPILDTSKINLTGDVECQISQLLDIVRLTKEEVDSINILLRDLANNFYNIWPGKYIIYTS